MIKLFRNTLCSCVFSKISLIRMTQIIRRRDFDQEREEVSSRENKFSKESLSLSLFCGPGDIPATSEVKGRRDFVQQETRIRGTIFHFSLLTKYRQWTCVTLQLLSPLYLTQYSTHGARSSRKTEMHQRTFLDRVCFTDAWIRQIDVSRDPLSNRIRDDMVYPNIFLHEDFAI